MRGLYLFIGGTLSRLFRAFAGKLGNTRQELGGNSAGTRRELGGNSAGSAGSCLACVLTLIEPI